MSHGEQWQTAERCVSQSRKAADELSEGLESVRAARIASLNAEREAIATVEVSMAEAEARVDQYMSELRGPLADFYVGHFMAAGKFDKPLPKDPGLLALALSGEQLGEYVKKKMRRQMEQSGHTGLSVAEREAKLTAINRELLDLELVEESLIRTAERGGFEVLRRHDATILAVLADDSLMPE